MSNEISTVDAIITVASWEPRFLLGIRRTLEKFTTRRVVAYFFAEYSDRTEEARKILGDFVKDQLGLVFEEIQLDFREPRITWRRLERDLGPDARVGKRLLLDITTMPRELIWSALFWLEASATEVQYVYNRPKKYAKNWLARDPAYPRLVFKLSGTLEFGRQTALVAVTGFDENRCRQAVEFYEPTHVLLAAQGGKQYKNNRRNVGPTFAASGIHISHIEVDAFKSGDHGYGVLREHIEKLSQAYNVILCSFGPKPSAVALYRLQREFPQCALAYIGCREYNPKYSEGLGEAVEGSILPQMGNASRGRR